MAPKMKFENNFKVMQVIIKIFIIFLSIYWTSGNINLIKDSQIDVFNKIVVNILIYLYG